jgi:thiosulfate/3-mercaptopyruvate sulfurtransferase
MSDATPFTTLVSTADLAAHLDNPDWVIIDVRYSLTDHDYGVRRYLDAHIPGAVYANLGSDLSSPQIPGRTGRHPLPSVETITATLSQLGVDARTQVVVYDDNSGVYAGRLWWMLRWLGHDAVAVLDGDWRAWQREGRPFRTGVETRKPRTFVAHLRPELVVTAEEIEARLHDPSLRLYDARGADRFRGENETLDAVCGHIPGARSAPYAGNLDADGRMLPSAELRARYTELLGDTPSGEAIFYCGSGVSVAHDALALQHAGLDLPRVYVGSWSDWISNGQRPVER